MAKDTKQLAVRVTAHKAIMQGAEQLGVTGIEYVDILVKAAESKDFIKTIQDSRMKEYERRLAELRDEFNVKE